MAEVAYFFDTYAIVELVEGNPSYQPYSNATAVLSVFNLAELYWVVLNKLGRNQAREVYATYSPAIVELDDETVQEAIEFRRQHKKRRLSYADCIGYVYSRRHGMLFLTGDKEFEGMDAVEFVK